MMKRGGEGGGGWRIGKEAGRREDVLKMREREKIREKKKKENGSIISNSGGQEKAEKDEHGGLLAGGWEEVGGVKFLCGVRLILFNEQSGKQTPPSPHGVCLHTPCR